MGNVNTGLTIASLGVGVGLVLVSMSPSESGESVLGITNMGNTCFLNSLLQSYSACPSFVEYLEDILHLEASDTDFLIVRELSTFLQSLRSADAALTPSDLISSLSHKFKGFGEQHDSHEIACIIQETIEGIGRRAQMSFIQSGPHRNPFLGLSSTQTRCEKCRHPSLRLDAIYDISLEITNDLQDSLALLAHPEIIDEFVCFKCSLESSQNVLKERIGALDSKDSTVQELELQLEHLNNADLYQLSEADLLCKVKGPVSIHRKIGRLPRILCFHLKWLGFSLGNSYKKDGKLDFPLQLQLNEELCLEESSAAVIHNLKAVIEHIGTSYGGHYICYKCADGLWFRCSDANVTQVSRSEVLSARPYMLFYERVEN